MAKPKPRPARSNISLGLALLVAVLVSTAVVGVAVVVNSRTSRPAAVETSPQMYLSPASATAKPGSTLTVQVRENSGSTAVNAVQANISYPTDKFEFASINTDGGAFDIAAPSQGSDGTVKIARGATTAVTGNKLVATVTFTVKSAEGQGQLTFADGSALVTSVTNSNLLTTTGPTTIMLEK